ncbi:MAG: lipocalin family protein [Tannerellaceae bacterium]
MEVRIYSLLYLLLTTFWSCTQTTVKRDTVKYLDLNLYMGKWYEIARFNHRFEYNLVGVTTELTALPDGKIGIYYVGYRGGLTGAKRSTQGYMQQPDPNKPGVLKATFLLGFTLYHYILELDEKDYSYALIGSDQNNNLWIVSRTPCLPTQTVNHLLTQAKRHGYNTKRLIWVEQPDDNKINAVQK